MTGLKKYKLTVQTPVALTHCFLPTAFSYEVRGTFIGDGHGLFESDSITQAVRSGDFNTRAGTAQMYQE